MDTNNTNEAPFVKDSFDQKMEREAADKAATCPVDPAEAALCDSCA
jgi:hypothetical protein